jgi:XTP/dITP diphosphohydrolase
MKPDKIIIATNNVGKIREFQHLLADFPITLVAQTEMNLPSVPETGTTFIENAIIKARYASQATGLPAIADDSGIEVDYLHGEPGVHSSSYSGVEADFSNHIKKLLAVLKDVPDKQRQARFRSTLVYLRFPTDPAPVIAQATWTGSVLREPHGSGGFGYDPIFYVPEYHCSAAELTPAQKNQLSHRGKALHLLLEQLTVEFAS